MITNETKIRLCVMAEQATPAAKCIIEELYFLEKAIAEFEGATCTGKEHWRDRGCDTKSPKLYVIHSIDQACPLHGKPVRGKRIRTYVGTKPYAINEAQSAIGRHEKLTKLQREEHRLNSNILAAVHCLEQFHRLAQSMTAPKAPPPPGKMATATG